MQGEGKLREALQESKVSYSSTSACCSGLTSSISEAIIQIGTAAVLVVGGAWLFYAVEYLSSSYRCTLVKAFYFQVLCLLSCIILHNHVLYSH